MNDRNGGARRWRSCWHGSQFIKAEHRVHFPCKVQPSRCTLSPSDQASQMSQSNNEFPEGLKELQVLQLWLVILQALHTSPEANPTPSFLPGHHSPSATDLWEQLWVLRNEIAQIPALNSYLGSQPDCRFGRQIVLFMFPLF